MPADLPRCTRQDLFLEVVTYRTSGSPRRFFSRLDGSRRVLGEAKRARSRGSIEEVCGWGNGRRGSRADWGRASVLGLGSARGVVWSSYRLKVDARGSGGVDLASVLGNGLRARDVVGTTLESALPAPTSQPVESVAGCGVWSLVARATPAIVNASSRRLSSSGRSFAPR
jgi:hypothetical protein